MAILTNGLRGHMGAAQFLTLFMGTFALGTDTSSSADLAWVTPDGREIRLVRSQSELAVTFRSHGAVIPCAKDFAAEGVGIISDFRHSAASLTKHLRSADVSFNRRAQILQDPAVAEVRSVYRLRSDSGSALMSSGTLNVRVRAELTWDEVYWLWQDYEVEVVEAVAGLPNTYLLRPAGSDADEVVAARALAHDERTIWAQPNFRTITIPQQIEVADQFFSRQFYLEPGTDSNDGISATEAWSLSQGQDVLIGMVDDACDVDHEDLRNNYSGVGHDISVLSGGGDDEAIDPSPLEFGDRHGTAVMGIAVARGNNLGGRGVAFQSRFTVSRGLDRLATFQEIASAYTFALQQAVDVHINSWSLPADTPNPAIIVDALERAAREGRDPNPSDDEDEPLGMVIVFASGDGVTLENGSLLTAGQDFDSVEEWEGLFQEPSVIGVGATDGAGRVAEYSNFADGLDLLAPGGTATLGIFTTDNRDNDPGNLVFSVDDGFNIGGTRRNSNDSDVESTGNYTENFFGTSASCPMVAGVAALMLSVNPTLKASDVRIILEHTSDRINPEGAAYDNISGRSREYGYGRVNAESAVKAATDALLSNGRAWPERPGNVRRDGEIVSWNTDERATGFLVVQTPSEFNFATDVDDPFPLDGACYSTQQVGCVGQQGNLEPLPDPNMQITAIVPFDESTQGNDGTCDNGCTHILDGLDASGNTSYAVFARNGISRYSWGTVAVEVSGDDGSNGAPTTGPRVTIMASAIEGRSPLTVVFRGNAQATSLPVDDQRAVWDFDVNDESGANALSRNATWTYSVPDGEGTQVFTARLTMFDVDGNPGFAEIQITVEGTGDDGTSGGASDISIAITEQGTSSGTSTTVCTSPCSIVVSIDATNLAGAINSIFWDLGDGTTSTSLVVPHTYINQSSAVLRIPITAQVSTSNQTLAATRILSVQPGGSGGSTGDPTLDGAGARGGNGAIPCGPLGAISPLLTLGGMLFVRRRISMRT